MTEERPAHSPLGASSAERWMNCPGSVALIKELAIVEETDEPDYRKEGTAAHEALAQCLATTKEAWEVVGQKYNDVEVTPEMATAIQVFIDEATPLIGGARQVYIEHGISAPIHPLFYGTVDFAVQHGIAGRLLDVLDFKYGQGVFVEVENNPQIMYYAYGILLLHPEVETVRLAIVQPRIVYAPPIREWTVSADTIRAWATETLAPAMVRTQLDHTLDAGPWCRFCPAKLVCPLLTSLFKAAATHDPKEVVSSTNEALGRSYQFVPAVKHYLKALEDETYRRLNLSMDVPGTKLVPKKANRAWKADAKDVFTTRFGTEAMTEPGLKSPAEMEKISRAAKELVHEYAFTPQTGLTVALADDNRPAVKVQRPTEAFAGVLANLVDSGAAAD